MSFDQAAVNALISAVESIAAASGAFSSVNTHEPKSAPGSGLRCAIWAQEMAPLGAASGLAATSGYVILNLRIYGNMLTKPEDDIDPRMMAAATDLLSQFSGDYTLGGTIRNIDLLGSYGEKLGAKAGYLTIGSTMFRVMTITVPCVINDLWVHGGIPSADESPGRSLQVDSLGVTGGASIGGALTVGGDASVTGDTSVGGGLTVTDAASIGGLVSAGGGVTISDVPGPSGPHPFGYGNSESLTGLQIISSYPSDDVSGGTDGTGRITLYSYQRANAYSFGETIRNFLMRWDAKAMTAWYGPTSGSSGSLAAAYDVNGNATGSNYKPWTWVGSHYEANDHASIHGHWEVEIPDSTGALQGRFSIAFADPVSGAIGLDKTNIVTNIADFTFQAHGTDHTGAYQEQFLRISAPAGFEKPLEFNNASTLANVAAGTRWRMLANNTAETGANAGSDLAIRRYDDSGGLLATGLFIQRSDGQIATGGAGPLGARIGVTWGTSGIAGFYAKATSSPGSAAAFYSELTATSDRLLQCILIGDTNNRFITQGSGTMLWGPGNATQDTNLYRGGLNLLKTDDSLEVATSLGVGVAPVHVFDVSSSASGGLAQFARTSTSDTTPVVLVLAGDTSTAQAIGVTVSGDAVSRFGIDPTGRASWGDGTNARDTNLYRSAVNLLKTDDSFQAATVGIGTTPGSLSLSVSRSASGQVAQLTRTSTADTSPVLLVLAGDTSTAQAIGISVNGDGVSRLGIDPTGKLTWGDGTNARDVNLYRGSAGVLKTDESLTVSGTLGVGQAAGAAIKLGVSNSAAGQLAGFTRTSTTDSSPVVVILAGDTSTSSALALSVNGDANNRFAIDPTGILGWGSGSTTRDVTLFRASAGVLETAGTLHAGTNFRLNTTSLGGGTGVLAMANAGTPPALTPTGGGVLYVSGGALLYKGSSGTVTTIAPA